MSNPKDPMSKFFEKDIANEKRSNFNLSYKNRLTMDFGYLYPVGLYDVPSDSHFELDLLSALSSNPTLSPILGTIKFRAEAYFVEKAAYNNALRNNNKVPIDRNVPWPIVSPNTTSSISATECYCSTAGTLLELLQMYPNGWHANHFIDDPKSPNRTSMPALNGIPIIMYYDIYRNYYCNPQDDAIPLRNMSYVAVDADSVYSPVDKIITRAMLDTFVDNCRSTGTTSPNVAASYERIFGIPLFSQYGTSGDTEGIAQRRATEFTQDRYRNHGLLRRTWNNDFFTSYLSNANVDLMRQHSKVQVSNNVFNMEQISLANRNWRFATRSLLWGTDWKDYNKVHYGVDLLIPYGKPQFLGAISSDLTFNDVISQAQTGDNATSDVTSNTNLGSRAALAYGALKDNGRYIEFNTKDEGYVMILLSLVPDVDYSQGIDPMFFKTNLQHSWTPEFNSVGMQDFMSVWQYAVGNSSSQILPDGLFQGAISFDDFNSSIHKVPIWFEYMAKYNQLHGGFTRPYREKSWVFSRDYSVNRTEGAPYSSLNSTYVEPEMLNYIFANSLSADNFQVQVRFDCKISMMLDKQVIAYL